MKGSRVEFAKNRLILDQLYSIPPPSLSIQMDHKGYLGDSSNSLAVMASFVLPNVYGSNPPLPHPSLSTYKKESKKAIWDPIMEKMERRLAGWKKL